MSKSLTSKEKDAEIERLNAQIDHIKKVFDIRFREFSDRIESELKHKYKEENRAHRELLYEAEKRLSPNKLLEFKMIQQNVGIVDFEHYAGLMRQKETRITELEKDLKIYKKEYAKLETKNISKKNLTSPKM